MGPTAAGKTALTLALHERLPVDVISVDSSQVYRGMDIGTAKPTPEQQALAPHRLIDIRDPAEFYSAADFRADALAEMEAIRRAGRIPLLVGGTMLYFHALEYGLSPLPSADATIRQGLTEQSSHIGWAGLHARLREVDPDAAARIHPHDAQRIQRALEIVELTGKAPTHWYRQVSRNPLPYELIRIGIYPAQRRVLHERIHTRFQRMLEQGLVAEVQCLRQRGDLSAELPSMRTVGYRQVWQYLTGVVNYNEMAQRGVIATRQLAKRQLTWLRRYRDVHYFDSTDQSLATACASYLARRLDPTGS
ncbi:MAG: tRNA (adenosine(37)-N6)-dimethylallyltransferase MiaA [Acidiferrobacterales bacterium]